MKEITYFYLAGCPHCKRADGYIEELIAENPAYGNIKITKIEERQNAKIADSYDYYYVPALFIGKDKLHEGTSTKDGIEAVLKKAIG